MEQTAQTLAQIAAIYTLRGYSDPVEAARLHLERAEEIQAFQDLQSQEPDIQP